MPVHAHEPEGIPFMVNGRPHRLRGISLTDGPGKLPVWLVDVDGTAGAAGMLEAALLHAARALEAKR